MDRGAALRSRDLRSAGRLLVAVGVFLLLAAIAQAWNHEQDGVGSAADRCPPPANGVDGSPWSDCLDRESARSGVEIAMPTVLVATGCVLWGTRLVRSLRLEASTG